MWENNTFCLRKRHFWKEKGHILSNNLRLEKISFKANKFTVLLLEKAVLLKSNASL